MEGTRRMLRLVSGNLVDLKGDDLEKFFIFAYKSNATNRTLLAFGMPLLFMLDWLRDWAMLPEASGQMLVYRVTIMLAMLLCSVVGSIRHAGYWREWAGFAWTGLTGAGVVITSLYHPGQLNLAHVVIILLCIILTPYGLRPILALALPLTLVASLLYLLMRLDVEPGQWPIYLLPTLLGCAIGLAHRRAYLDSALDTFLLRKRLLARLHTDSLTNILNREGWEVNVERFKRFRHKRTDNVPYSVVYFDLDHFKQVNDQEGHAMGDKILCSATNIMRARSRPGELLARLGGEEFVSLLPNADEAAAWQYAERIRQAIEDNPGPSAVKVTISAGVAQAGPEDTLETLITRADNAMLEAKRRGRNRVLKVSSLGDGTLSTQQAQPSTSFSAGV